MERKSDFSIEGEPYVSLCFPSSFGARHCHILGPQGVGGLMRLLTVNGEPIDDLIGNPCIRVR